MDASRSERRHNGDLYQTIGQLTEAVQSLKNDIAEIKTKVDHIEATANRYKGAFAAILGFGALLGWFADKLAAWIRH